MPDDRRQLTIELWHQIINYQAALDKWSVLREGPVHWYKLSGITVDPTDLMVLVPSYHIQPHYSTATASSVLALLIEIHTIYIGLMIGPMRDRLSDHVTTSQSCYLLAIDLIDSPALNIDNCVNNLLQHIARPPLNNNPAGLAGRFDGLSWIWNQDVNLLCCIWQPPIVVCDVYQRRDDVRYSSVSSLITKLIFTILHQSAPHWRSAVGRILDTWTWQWTHRPWRNQQIP